MLLENVKKLLPSDAVYLGGWMCQGRMPGSVRARFAAHDVYKRQVRISPVSVRISGSGADPNMAARQLPPPPEEAKMCIRDSCKAALPAAENRAGKFA